jgi:hypothetical protein
MQCALYNGYGYCLIPDLTIYRISFLLQYTIYHIFVLIIFLSYFKSEF